MRNKDYIDWLTAYATKRQRLQNNKVPHVLDGAGPDPVFYTQHFLNAIKSLKGYFMVVQTYDHGYQFQADHLFKTPTARFMILGSYKAQDEANMIEVIDTCEYEAEQIIAKIHADAKTKNANGKVLDSFDLNQVQIEKLFLPDNKCGVGVAFPIQFSHSNMLVLDNDWT